VSYNATPGLFQEQRERGGELKPAPGILIHSHPGGGRGWLSGCSHFDPQSWKMAITGFHKCGMSALFAYVTIFMYPLHQAHRRIKIKTDCSEKQPKPNIEQNLCISQKKEITNWTNKVLHRYRVKNPHSKHTSISAMPGFFYFYSYVSKTTQDWYWQ